MRRFLILLLFFISVFYACNSEEQKTSQTGTKTAVAVTIQPAHELVYKYGFCLDSFAVRIDTVKNGQTLSHVFLPLGLNQAEINEADLKGRDSLIGLDFIVPGHIFTSLYLPGDTIKPQYIVYEKNKLDYVIYDVRNGVNLRKSQRKHEVRTREVAGRISSSLWNAFIGKDLSPDLVVRVINAYQWSVDFFSIQPNDYYKLVFDEVYVDDKAIAVDNVRAIELHTYDSSYYAFPFEVDGKISFYDIEGGSLRKALLKAPLDYIRVSSKFSNARRHPVLGIVRPHHGVDYAAPLGTPVVSVGDGVVTRAGWAGGAGRMIVIKHNDKIKTYYLHLHKMNVKAGDHVDQGQVIGQVGSTGLSTGPHLDYRIEINGKKVDPLSAQIPTSEPLDKKYLPAYMEVSDSLRSMLEAIPIPPVLKEQKDSSSVN